MKRLFGILLGVLFLSASGLALADERDHDEHGGARIIVVPAKHNHRRRRHVKVVHPAVELRVGIGVHDNRWHYDHDYDNNWRAKHRWNDERHDWEH